jgi:predicted HNH restriction endonuclease
MSQHLDDVLYVLTRLARSCNGDSVAEVTKARRTAARAISAERGVAYDTINDACRRRLEPDIAGTDAFDAATAEWLQGETTQLQTACEKNCKDDQDREAVQAFFSRHAGATPVAADSTDPTQPDRVQVNTYRILRDTALARRVKEDLKYKCQLCPATLSLVGRLYAEAHHVKPLGRPHNGPDVRENIVCVCPTCHVKLDYGAIRISADDFPAVAAEFIDYHNDQIAVEGAV